VARKKEEIRVDVYRKYNTYIDVKQCDECYYKVKKTRINHLYHVLTVFFLFVYIIECFRGYLMEIWKKNVFKRSMFFFVILDSLPVKQHVWIVFNSNISCILTIIKHVITINLVVIWLVKMQHADNHHRQSIERWSDVSK
jgi:hypothetical protein